MRQNHAYVDAVISPRYCRWNCGFVIVTKDGKKYKGLDHGEPLSDISNGELISVIHAIREAEFIGLDSLTIYFNCDDVELLALDLREPITDFEKWFVYGVRSSKIRNLYFVKNKNDQNNLAFIRLEDL